VLLAANLHASQHDANVVVTDLFAEGLRIPPIKIFDKGVDYKDPKSFGEYQLSYRTGDIISPKIDTTEPLGEEVRTFLHAIRTGEAPLTDGHNGLAVVEALAAADGSLREGGRVEVLAPAAVSVRERALAS